MRTTQLLILAMALLLMAACGPDGEDDSPDGHWLDDFDCERLERETFEDCTYEEGMSLNGRFLNHEDFRAQLGPFCASPCNKSDGISVDTGGSSITDVAPLRGIREITGGLELTGGGLASLAGIGDLAVVQKNFRMYGTSNIQGLQELGSLTTVGGAFQVSEAAGLQTLDGLENLKSANHIGITYNPELESIEALESLETARTVLIANNPKLPTCEAEDLVDRLGLSSDEYSIRGNGTGSCDN